MGSSEWDCNLNVSRRGAGTQRFYMELRKSGNGTGTAILRYRFKTWETGQVQEIGNTWVRLLAE
jgi:hypothetical protein